MEGWGGGVVQVVRVEDLKYKELQYFQVLF